MRWAHPLKGRTIREALADALTELGKGRVTEWDLASNLPLEIRNEGVVSWSADNVRFDGRSHFHSWNTMRDCLKYGFDLVPDCDGEISARDTDWSKALREKQR